MFDGREMMDEWREWLMVVGVKDVVKENLEARGDCDRSYLIVLAYVSKRGGQSRARHSACT